MGRLAASGQLGVGVQHHLRAAAPQGAEQGVLAAGQGVEPGQHHLAAGQGGAGVFRVPGQPGRVAAGGGEAQAVQLGVQARGHAGEPGQDVRGRGLHLAFQPEQIGRGQVVRGQFLQESGQAQAPGEEALGRQLGQGAGGRPQVPHHLGQQAGLIQVRGQAQHPALDAAAQQGDQFAHGQDLREEGRPARGPRGQGQQQVAPGPLVREDHQGPGQVRARGQEPGQGRREVVAPIDYGEGLRHLGHLLHDPAI